MKRYFITIPQCLEKQIKQLIDVLRELEVKSPSRYDLTTGDYGVGFEANLSTIQHRLLCAYLESLDAETPIQMVEEDMTFLFANHYGTDLAPHSIEKVMLSAIGKFNESIMKTIGHTTAEFQAEARVTISEYCKSILDMWSRPK